MTVTNGNAKHNGVDPSPLPIVIAGGGCVGLFLALLLVQSSIPNRVIVSNLPSSIFSVLTYVSPTCRSSNHYIPTLRPLVLWPTSPSSFPSSLAQVSCLSSPKLVASPPVFASARVLPTDRNSSRGSNSSREKKHNCCSHRESSRRS